MMMYQGASMVGVFLEPEMVQNLSAFGDGNWQVTHTP